MLSRRSGNAERSSAPVIHGPSGSSEGSPQGVTDVVGGDYLSHEGRVAAVEDLFDQPPHQPRVLVGHAVPSLAPTR